MIRIVTIFLGVLFPAKCLVCGDFFKVDTTRRRKVAGDSFPHVMGCFFCSRCRRDIGLIRSPKCSVCGFMFESREGDDHACATCIGKPPAFGKARAYGRYDGSLRAAIHLLKYRGKVYLAEPLGLLLFQEFVANWGPSDVDCIIPVPLHGKRLRKRGFNQTYQLIKKWPVYLEKTGGYGCQPKIEQGLLFRKKRTKAQVGMTRKERLANMRGVFAVRSPNLVEGRRFLVIDDVFTTGATANECAKTLLKNGAARVDVLTLAQTEQRLKR